jgi:hypothetical protein
MTLLPDNLGATLADELLKQSEQDANLTPIDAVMDAARGGAFTDDHCFRLLARLWTLKHIMYYVYGGWAQGINLNEYPPAALEEYELTGALIRP